MHRLIISFVLLAPTLAFAATVTPAEWTSCTVKSDCVAIYNNCCGYEAVNLSHTEAAKKKFEKSAILCSASCVPPASESSYTNCIKGHCQITGYK